MTKGGNSTINGGGAMRIEESDITIVNSSFVHNLSTTFDGSNLWGGGGAINVNEGNLTLVNCVLTNNTAQYSFGGAIQACNYATVQIYNSILRNNNDYDGANSLNGNTFSVYNSIIDQSFEVENFTKINCYEADPLFTDPNHYNFSLQENSPCINAGTSENLEGIIPSTDIFGNQRIVQQLIDIGVAEYQQEIDLTISGTLTTEKGDTIAGYTLYDGITTDSKGHFSLKIDGTTFSTGDTITLLSNDGFEIYPSKLILNWNSPRYPNLKAFHGLVIDEFYDIANEIHWSEDTVNIFTDITLTQSSLIIDKGTSVRFHGLYGITIMNGSVLKVNGTIDDTVSFNYAYPELSNPSTSNLSYCWKGLSFLAQNKNIEASTLDYCKIENVKHNGDGGAIYAYYFPKLTISHCLINNNQGDKGAGLFLYESDISIFNTVISNNNTRNKGGWMYLLGGGGLNLQYSNPIVSGCIIANNGSYFFGGGMLLFYSNPIISNCTFYSNSKTSETGQALSLIESIPSIYNTIIDGKKDIQVYVWDTDTKAGLSTIKNSCIKNGNAFGASNYINSFDKNPLFADSTNTQFKLSPASPCINKGTTEFADFLLLKYDIHNDLRVMGPNIEIGACEFAEATPVIIAPEITAVNISTQVSATTCYGTASNWIWDFENDGTNDEQGQIAEHTYTSAGTYTIKLTAYMNDSAVNLTVYQPILVVEAPIAEFYCSDTLATLGDTIRFFDTSLNQPSEWLWDFGDGTISTLQNPKHTYTAIGRYTVSLKATNVAGSDSLIREDYINITGGTGISVYELFEVNIYPNPTEASITITAPIDSKIQIFDNTGRLIKSTKATGTSTNYDLSSLKQGMYFIKVTKDNDSVMRKLIKE